MTLQLVKWTYLAILTPILWVSWASYLSANEPENPHVLPHHTEKGKPEDSAAPDPTPTPEPESNFAPKLELTPEPTATPTPEPTSTPSPSPSPSPSPKPVQLAIKTDYTMPVVFDGQQVGSTVLTVGTPLELEREENGMLICRQGKQRFRIPASVTNYDPAMHLPNKAARLQEKVEKEKKVVAVKAKLDDWERVIKYADRVKDFTTNKKQTLRIQQYTYMQAQSPNTVRIALLRLIKNPELSVEKQAFVKTLKSAFSNYDARRWAEFETLTLEALSNYSATEQARLTP